MWRTAMASLLALVACASEANAADRRDAGHSGSAGYFRLAASGESPAARATRDELAADVAETVGDYATALRLLRSLAAQNDVTAEFNLGIVYDSGRGVPVDHAEALRWYAKAADQGYPLAQFNLGVAYEQGKFLVQDYAAAARWYSKSADQGYAGAEANLGILYFNGQGVPQRRCRRRHRTAVSPEALAVYRRA